MVSKNQKYSKSLRIYQVASLLRALWFGMFISIIFLKFVGLNDFAIAVAHLIMGVSIFIFEIPTGFFADKYGFKDSIVLSYAFIFLAFSSLVASAFYGAWLALIVAPLMFGIHYAFSSGASSAYVFSIFKINKNKKGYLRFNSHLRFYTSILTAIAAIVGAYLYVINPVYPYAIQAGLMVVAIIFVLFLEKLPRSEIKVEKFLNQVRSSLKVFKKHSVIIKLFVFLFIVNASYIFFLHLTDQSFWLEKGLSIELIGILGAIVLIIEGGLTLLSPKILSYFGERKAYLILAVCAMIVPILLAYSQNFILIALFSGLMFALASIISHIFDYSLQLRLNDATRATTASIGNMFVSLGHKLSLVGVGYLLVQITYSFSLVLFALTLGSVAVLFAIFVLRKME